MIHNETPNPSTSGFGEKARVLPAESVRNRGKLTSLLGVAANLRAPLESGLQGDAAEQSRRPRPV